VSLETPEKIRILQRKLYRKAKEEPNYRFYQLYDKIYREDILIYAYAQVKANDGSAGADGEDFEAIEAQGLAEWLRGIIQELRTKTYKPKPVNRVWIDKPGGGQRPLGIPCIVSFRQRCMTLAARDC
jgi:RNA-directed DNA polymerase